MALQSLIVLSALISAQEPKGTVTYGTPGALAGRVLRELSVKTGLTLLASPPTEKEVLTIYLLNASVKETLDRVAWAVGGSWKREGEAYRLVRTSEEAAAEKARERKFIVESFGKALAKRKDELAASGDLTAENAEAIAKETAVRIRKFDPEALEGWEYIRRLAGRSPEGRALTRVMSLLTPEELADLPKGIRVAYATKPTRAQRPLGNIANGIVADLFREQEVWQRALAKHQVKNPTIDGSSYRFVTEPMAEGQNSEIGKVLFAATRVGTAAVAIVELIVADPKGKVIAHAEATISSLDAGSRAPAPANGEVKVAKGGEAAIIAERSNRPGGNGIPDALRLRLTRSEEIDPAGILGGETVLNAAKAKGINLVATFTDGETVTMMHGPRETSYSEWLHSTKRLNEVREEPGWLAIRPHEAASHRLERVDRAVLGPYLRRKAAVERIPLEEQAKWAARLPVDEAGFLTRTLAAAVPKGGMAERAAADGRILRLFGSLTLDQRAAARQGGLSLSRVTPEQIDMIARLVYGQNARLEPDGAKAVPVSFDADPFAPNLMREATEAVPNGIPSDGSIEIVDQSEEVVFTGDTESKGMAIAGQPINAQQLGWQVFALSRLDLFPQMGDPVVQERIKRLQMGTRKTYTITVRLSPTVVLRDFLEDREYTGDKTSGIEGLPEKFRSEVVRHVEEYRKQYANAKPRVTKPTTQNPPPPRIR